MPKHKQSDHKKPHGKKDYAPQASDRSHPCDVAGCKEPGVYKAPRSREMLGEYRWLCLEHIREHNQKWDYFAGLERDDIEDFIKESVTGHRPTWTRESQISYSQKYNKLQDVLYEFLTGGKKTPQQPPIAAKLRKALAVMDMNYPYTEQELKKQYRLMVKKYHPDANKGDKKSEETFKHITVAYHALLEHLKKPSNV